MTDRKWLIRLLGLVCGLGLFGWVIWNAVGKTQSVEWPELPVSHILLALALVLVAHGLTGLAWVIGARHSSENIGMWSGVGMYSLSMIGRYIPGKIWQIGGLSYLAQRRGADPYEIAGYSLIFLIFSQVIGALLVTIAYFTIALSYGWMICIASAPILAFVISGLYTISSGQMISHLPSKWQDRLRSSVHLPFDTLAINLLLLAIVRLIFGTAGYVLVLGFAPEWVGTWTQVIMATIAGFLAGVLVLIAPSGAGVRESTISVWLTSMGVSPIASIAMAVALRVIMTASEVLWAAFGALIIFCANPAPSEHKG